MTIKTKTTINLRNIHLSLQLGRWRFRPGLLPTIAVFLLLPLLLHLGFWQRQRAVDKQQILDQFALRAHQAPIPLANYYEPVYTPVQVSGSYDKDHIILLDNRIVNHQVGYDVLAPFIPFDGRPGVLVNLGWVAKNAVVNKETFQSDHIAGLVYPPQHSFLLARPKMEIVWPLLVEEIRIDQLSRILNRPLYPFTLLLSGNEGFTHHWEFVPSVSPARHRAYAFQWFALALTLVILYIKLNIRREKC